MNEGKNVSSSIVHLGFVAMVMHLLSLLLLVIVAVEGIIAPVALFAIMIIFGSILITIFSNNEEIFFKIKLFVFFFSTILVYTLMNHYVLVNFFPENSPYLYADGPTFYFFSNLALPYIIGKKNFFDLFSLYILHELPLHVVFSSSIAYFSILFDGENTIIIQKLLSPFLGGMFSVVLYSTLKYQFKDTSFALNATLVYTLFSAVFIYATSLMRDLDIALAYMIFIYVFFQPSSYKNFFLLLLVAFTTTYLRPESGLVLYGIILLYAYLYVGKVQSIRFKTILYIFLVVIFSIVILLMYNKISLMIEVRNVGDMERSISMASSSSIGVLLNKLPFPLDKVAKVLFGQIQPFPFFLAIDRPPEAISGIFWPFVFCMMLYAVLKKNIRTLLDKKVKYLLMVAITILFLMSSEPMARRMMSVYPIMYITSLYVFFYFESNKIKRIFVYYLFAIITLNVFYYMLKI